MIISIMIINIMIRSIMIVFCIYYIYLRNKDY